MLSRLEVEGIVGTTGTGPQRNRHATDPSALLDLWAEENGDKPVRTRGFLLAQTSEQIINEVGERLNGARVEYALTDAAAASVTNPSYFNVALKYTISWIIHGSQLGCVG